MGLQNNLQQSKFILPLRDVRYMQYDKPIQIKRWYSSLIHMKCGKGNFHTELLVICRNWCPRKCMLWKLRLMTLHSLHTSDVLASSIGDAIFQTAAPLAANSFNWTCTLGFRTLTVVIYCLNIWLCYLSWFTMLQAERSLIRDPLRWIFINLPNPSGCARPWVHSASNRN
jgi:hypothetical protein